MWSQRMVVDYGLARRATLADLFSGGLTVDTAAAYGASGVDYLSVGGLTHSSPALDLGLDLRSR